MKRGRPKTIRSKDLSAWGTELSEDQREAVRAILTAFIVVPRKGGKEKVDKALSEIADAFSTYSGYQRARDAFVSAGEEAADLSAIADDASAVATGVAGRDVLSRLRQRLRSFPPFAEARIATMRGVDNHLARLARLSDTRLPPTHADLVELAEDCRADTGPTRRRTKPTEAARDELAVSLAAIAVRYELAQPGQMERADFVRDALEVCGLTFPKNLRFPKSQP